MSLQSDVTIGLTEPWLVDLVPGSPEIQTVLNTITDKQPHHKDKVP